MKHFLLSLIAVLLTFGIAAPDVEAKRLGGGSSLGMQRQMTPQQAPRQAAAPAPQQANPAPTAPRRSWMGPLAGLAAGLGLAALFAHLGLGEELASLVMIGLLVFAAVMLYRLLTRRGAAAPGPQTLQYAGAPAPAAPDRGLPAASAAGAPALLADFDADAFIREAKVHFIRLQAAHDAGNLDDIRAFTTPEMFAEIRLQIAERGNAAQRTDVVELTAEIVEVVEEPLRYIVSMRFSGLLREEADAAPAAFDEIWHLTKPRSGNAGWVIAGIQQVA